ncbi:GOLPH3/VPS74 family protein [Nonomuraea typhae]|uniref:GOLPH3/VPS74 family protein n=1 Tax=Nonomuraea typhae TaxID=2603600 RepID=UPI0012FC758E|nr:GPP34 family phosphoprotein [Nonomuraea typhae]
MEQSPPLYQDLFVVCHQENGKPLVHRSSIALGLAGAVLADLVLSGRVTLDKSGAAAAELTATGDPVIDTYAREFLRDPAGLDALTWAKGVAADVYDRTRRELVNAGVLVAVTGRRLGMLPYTRYQTDMAAIVRASADVRSAVSGWRDIGARGATLCGLVLVLQVHTELYIGQSDAQLGANLLTIARGHSPQVKSLVALVERLVGEAAVAVYR